MLQKIANIQEKIGKLTKDTKGYNYKYFDINQLLAKLQPLLREEGLVLTQPIVNGCVQSVIRDVTEMETLMYSEIKLPENVKPQDLGSAITYYRRYSLVSLLALEAEDDDGSKASAGLNKHEFAQVRDNYANNNVLSPEEWEKMSVEQKHIINEIKKTKRK